MNKGNVSFVACENCGAPMRLVPGHDHFHCDYCGSFAFPRPSSDGVIVLGERGNVDCPVCATRLSAASVADARVLHCATCQGLLARQDAFAAIVKFLRAEARGEPNPVRPLNREQLEREIGCPYCGQPMDTHPYYGPGNVVVDNCARCGMIWLDYGELAIIRDAPGQDRTRGKEADHSSIEDLLRS